MAWTKMVLGVGMALMMLGCRVSANFHTVDDHRLYRSAQLTKAEFKQAFEKLGIKTVINLRGSWPGDQWYKDEVAVTSEYGVKLIDIAMSPNRLPHRKDLVSLLDAFRDSERPMLVHCKAGADRTGEAVALYQMEYMGKSKSEALKSLTPKYLHFTQFLPAKRYFIGLYQGMSWAYSVYDPCLQDYRYYDKAAYCHDSATADVEQEKDSSEFLTE